VSRQGATIWRRLIPPSANPRYLCVIVQDWQNCFCGLSGAFSGLVCGKFLIVGIASSENVVSWLPVLTWKQRSPRFLQPSIFAVVIIIIFSIYNPLRDAVGSREVGCGCVSSCPECFCIVGMRWALAFASPRETLPSSGGADLSYVLGLCDLPGAFATVSRA